MCLEKGWIIPLFIIDGLTFPDHSDILRVKFPEIGNMFFIHDGVVEMYVNCFFCLSCFAAILLSQVLLGVSI